MASPSKKQRTKKKRKEGIRCKEVLKNGRKCDKLLLGKDELAVYCERCNEPTQFLVLLSEALEKGYLTKEAIYKSVPALFAETSFVSNPKAKIKESVMDKKGREEALEKIKELREKFDIKDDELFSVTRTEEPIEQKVEERKKEAVEKEILEKAEVIAQELGTSRVKKERKKLLPDLYEFLRFEDRNLKIRSRWPYFAVADPKGAYFYIYARQKGKAFKRLVFFCSWRRSKIEVYKPGPWEEVLNSLYQKALAHKKKKEKVKRDRQKQELAECFDL